MFRITKSFNLEYGHRVWTQELDKELSCGSSCACRHLHGHSGIVTLELGAQDTYRGMVLDFKNLEFVKKFIDDTLDHRFIVDKSDPWFIDLCQRYETTWSIEPDSELPDLFSRVVPQDAYPEWLVEIGQSFIVVAFVPTSELISQWLYEIASKKLLGIAQVSSVKWQETAKTSATYQP